MNDEERFICCQQQELYEYAQARQADMEAFSDMFLNSELCNNSLDKPYSVDQFADIANWLEFLEKDCPVIPGLFQKSRVTLSAAGWTGFTYRQLHFATGLSGKELARLVPFGKLVAAYPGLHTVDEDMAAEIIIKDFKLGINTR